MLRDKSLLIILIICAFIIRVVPIDFPLLTSDEAMIGVRGDALVKFGQDELGRDLPVIFNSSYDYQLPLTSYISMLGIYIFGKNDFGLRLPFIFIGTLVILMIYKLSKLFIKDERLCLMTAFLAAFSPALIFFSKVPNEFIILLLFLLIYIYLLAQKSINKLFMLAILILILLSSKVAWLVLVPLTIICIFRRNDLGKKEKIIIFFMSFSLTIITFTLFFSIPQSMRSMIEGNFSIFMDIGIKNGIERLRSQQIENWPNFLDRILFNKTHILLASFLNWVSHLQFSTLFGQLDGSGKFSFLSMGALPKIIILPFLGGIYFLIKTKDKIFIQFFLYIIVLSFPGFFIYPKFEVGLIILFLPFIIFISSFGFEYFNQKITKLAILLTISEVIIMFVFIPASIKNSSNIRPNWIKEIIRESDDYAREHKLFLSDNITPDIIPFLLWYSEVDIDKNSYMLGYPYKFQQTVVKNIKTIGFEDNFYICEPQENNLFIISTRDLNKIQNILKDEDVIPKKEFKDVFGESRAYFTKLRICIK